MINFEKPHFLPYSTTISAISIYLKSKKKKKRKKGKRLVLLSSTQTFANEEILLLFNVMQSQEEAKVNQKNYHYN